MEQGISCYREAITHLEATLRIDPDNIECHSKTGAVWNDLGLMLMQAKKYDQALIACQQAIAHQRVAFSAAPTVHPYRKFISNHYANLSRASRSMGRWEQALAACDQQRDLWSGNALELLAVARELAQIANAMDAVSPVSSRSDNAGLRSRCIDQALATLRASIDAGFSKPAFLEKDMAFATLRSDQGFEDLVHELISRQQSVPAKLTPRT